MFTSGTLSILMIALIVDRLVGDPAAIWSRVPHPVVGFGKLVGVFDHAFAQAQVEPLPPAGGRIAAALEKAPQQQRRGVAGRKARQDKHGMAVAGRREPPQKAHRERGVVLAEGA